MPETAANVENILPNARKLGIHIDSDDSELFMGMRRLTFSITINELLRMPTYLRNRLDEASASGSTARTLDALTDIATWLEFVRPEPVHDVKEVLGD